jgi:hypothetical protein
MQAHFAAMSWPPLGNDFTTMPGVMMSRIFDALPVK